MAIGKLFGLNANGKTLIQQTEFVKKLKVQSCKSYNGKYMIASATITNTEILAFIAVLVFKLLNRKVLLKNKKDTVETVKKEAHYQENSKFQRCITAKL